MTGKKRTREEILSELKSKRSEGGTTTKGTNIQTHVPVDKPLEDVRKDGKFKPIGFKPIASNAPKSKLKSKDDAKKEKEGRKKKKRKVEEKKEAPEGVTEENKKPVAESSRNTDVGPSITTKTSANERKSQNDEPPPNDDFDIFADAGEYEGINLDDDDDDDDESDADGERKATMPAPSSPNEPQTQTQTDPQHPRKRWFNDLEPSPPPERPLPSDSKGKGKDNVSPTNNGDEDPTPSVHRGGDVAVADKDVDANENGGEAPLSPPSKLVRLAPLASSAVPSIRDILAADEALEAEDKRRARKEKRKAGGGGEGEGSKSKGKGEVSSEAKLNRDYQRLQAYTKKKGESS